MPLREQAIYARGQHARDEAPVEGTVAPRQHPNVSTISLMVKSSAPAAKRAYGIMRIDFDDRGIVQQGQQAVLGRPGSVSMAAIMPAASKARKSCHARAREEFRRGNGRRARFR